MSAEPIYLAAAAWVTEASVVQRETPELWARLRRFNLPVQLALAAAERAASGASDIGQAALVSVAPFRSGSAALWDWVREQSARGDLSRARLNPTHTLHVVDNLALSAFALAHGNQGYGLGLGGAPGQAWCALEALLARLQAGAEEEALLMAGDHDDASHTSAQGVALLFSRRPTVCASLGRTVRVLALRRRPLPAATADMAIEPHSAAGLIALLHALATTPGGRWRYAVPPKSGDGVDDVELEMDVELEVERPGTRQRDDAA
jgi:hypothetical protein